MNHEDKYLKARASTSNATARARGAYGQIPPKDIRLRLDLQEGKCFHCDDPITLYSAEIDHVFPIVRGGEHYMYNIVLACHHCNHAKHAKKLKQFCKSRGLDVDQMRQKWAELNAKQHALTDFYDEYRPDLSIIIPDHSDDF